MAPRANSTDAKSSRNRTKSNASAPPKAAKKTVAPKGKPSPKEAPSAKASKPAPRTKVPAASVPPRETGRRGTSKSSRSESSSKLSNLLQGELPQGYGVDRLVAIPKDPEWTHLYWEISEDTRKSMSNGSTDGFRLRGFDTTGILFDGNNAPVALDIEVAPYARSWYVRLPYQGRVYTFEYGMVAHDGQWQPVARSRPVGFEPGMMGFRPDSEEWVSIASDELFRAAAGLGEGEGINDLINRLRSRNDGSGMLAGSSRLNTSGAGMGPFAPSSHASSSFGMQSLFAPSSLGTSNMGSQVSWTGVPGGRSQGPGGKAKDFWLWVETELILYGATEPDAQVTLMGRPIPLNPDGTFRVQFPFPHGTELHMDVRAVDRDGDQVREAKPAARRWTED